MEDINVAVGFVTGVVICAFGYFLYRRVQESRKPRPPSTGPRYEPEQRTGKDGSVIKDRAD